ncbi:sensor histidine kinase [Lysinibacillus sp. 54212]|uniref:sensor histidine kinase n=1 Tax=Lysinibacillus sp. 54212 TaxID=3119829 RepID=UPI002FC5D457
MKKNSIVFKLGTIIFILFLSILIPFAFFIDRIFLNVYSIYLNENIKETADRIVNAASTSNESMATYLENLDNITDHELIYFNNAGTISTEGFKKFEKGDTLPSEWQTKLKQGLYIDNEWLDESTNEKFYYIIQPFIKDEQFQGGVVVVASITELHSKMHGVRNWIIIAFIAAIILALGYTLFLSWRLSRPLIRMEHATREIAKGNLQTRIEVTSNDEIGSLARAINDLSIELNNYRSNRSELLANISHELRTPISYLKGYAQIIKDEQYASKDELQNYAAIIEGESNRLAKLIQELFELSKMEEGNIQLYVQLIDVEDLVQSVVQKVQLKANEKGLHLYSIVDERIPDIYTDGLRLEQILINLLENALNYTEQGEVSIKVKADKNHICFIIKDTGSGIPEEDILFIFDRFHRIEKSRVRHMGGTGLGLAIVRELSKHLQGEITVKSSQNNGSSFIVTLPIILTIEDENIKRNGD